MPIKPGDLVSNPPGPTPTMVWDGRRMRVLWQAHHGNGDPNSNLIPQAKTTIRGHPTWKLYDGDVASHIIQGKNEPPHYVYLDDRACYTTYSSNAYTTKELNKYWPFDFDRFGNILSLRPNRGRPAFTDASCTAYGAGPIRSTTTERYEFCGASDLLREYNVVPPKDRKQQPQAPEPRLSEQISLSGSLPDLDRLLSAAPTTTKTPPSFIVPKATLPATTTPVFSPPSERTSETPTGDTRVKIEDSAPTKYLTSPIADTSELPSQANQTSPHSNIPSAPATIRKRTLHGSLANSYSKRSVDAVTPVERRGARRGFLVESFVTAAPGGERGRVKEEEEEEEED